MFCVPYVIFGEVKSNGGSMQMKKLKDFWNKSSQTGYITNKIKFQIAFPAMPVAISNGLIHSAYIKYYTDIVGLNIKYVGIIWAMFGIWNAINDPVLGVFIDRFKYKPSRGKYTYLLRVTAPVTLLSSAAMLFAQPGWAEWLIFAFLTILLFIFDTTQTAYAISHANYVLVAAPTNDERLGVSVFQVYVGQAGAFMSMVIPTLLLVGDADRLLTMALFSLVLIFNSILYYLSLRPLKETEAMFREVQTHEGQLVEQLKIDGKSLVKSRSFITYLLYQVIGKGATIILFTQLLYMADDVLDFSGVQATLVDLIPGLIMLLFVPLFPKWSKTTGMKNLIIMSSVPIALGYIGLYFISNFWQALFVYTGIIIFTNVGNVLHPVMLGAIIDEDERRTGTRKAGLFTGMNALLSIPVGGLHTFIYTLILSYYGFVSGAEVQVETAQFGIRLASSFIPGALILLGVIPLLFLPITKNVERELSDFSKKMHHSHEELTATEKL